MDFTGQKAAEELSFVIVIATSIIALVAGAVKLRSHVSTFVCIELIAQLLACRLCSGRFHCAVPHISGWLCHSSAAYAAQLVLVSKAPFALAAAAGCPC